MEVREIKENLGKEVFFKDYRNKKLGKYILNAYIFRIDPKDSSNRLKQAELQDTNCPHSVIIVNLNDVVLMKKRSD